MEQFKEYLQNKADKLKVETEHNEFLNQDLLNEMLPLSFPEYVPMVKVPVISKEI